MVDTDDLEIPDFLRADKRPAPAPEPDTTADDIFSDPLVEELTPAPVIDPAELPQDPVDAAIEKHAKPAKPKKAVKGKKEEPKKEEPENPRAKPGNNSANDQLRSIVERIERLNEEKADLAEDIKEVYLEAKANGYDTKTIRRIIALRKQDAEERQEQEALLDLYLFALGMAPAPEDDE